MVKANEKDIIIKKTFEHFGEVFEVYTINGWDRKEFLAKKGLTISNG